MNERISFYHAYACRADKCDRHPALSPTLLGDTCFCSTQSGMALPAIQIPYPYKNRHCTT